VVQESTNQASEVPSTTKITIDLWVVDFLEGSLHVETGEERESAEKLKNLSLNLVEIPLHTLHEIN